MLVGLLLLLPATTIFSFEDIQSSRAKYEIAYLAERGIIQGISENIFEPLANITRAEFAAVVQKAFELGETEYDGRFSDVHQTDWFAKSVASVAEYGYMNGYDGKFNPYDTITNEEVCKILVCAFEQKAEPIFSPLAYNTVLTDFFDTSLWVREYVGKAEMIGLLSYHTEGKDIRMFPQSPCTREDAAWSVYNTLNAVQVLKEHIRSEEDE